MSYPVKNGQTSVVLRFKLLDSTSGTGQGKTGLTNASTGLIISTIADNEVSATTYTQAANHIQTIATLGTYAAPSASNCRFQEVDSTNHKGVYEFQFADARFAVSNAKSLIISVSGPAALGVAEADYVVPLTVYDPYAALATPTNITAGTITTVTNLTNAATAGDLTAAMKTSVQTAADAAVTANATIIEIEAETDGIAAIPTTPVLTAHFDTVIGTPVTSVSADIAALKSDLDGGVTITAASRPGIRKNTALANFEFVMTDSTTHAPKTGLTVAVTRSVDGAAYASGTIANIAEISNGAYKFDFGAGDLNGATIGVRCTATGADDLNFTVVTTP